VQDREAVKGDTSKQFLNESELRNNFNFHTRKVHFLLKALNDYITSIHYWVLLYRAGTKRGIEYIICIVNIYGKCVKDKNVNSKCTHRQMTRLWLTKDRPGLSWESVPQIQDNKFQTQTLEKEAISGQTSTKWARHQDMTDWLTDWLSAIKWLWLWESI
jgi:hypothetical protein